MIVVFDLLGDDMWGSDERLLDDSWLSVVDGLRVSDWSEDSGLGDGYESAESNELKKINEC